MLLVLSSMKITRFKGQHAFLSNFYPVELTLDGAVYRSVEAAYMAAKTDTIGEKQMLQQAQTGAEAKRLGKKVTVRADWNDEMRVEVMARLLVEKFRDAGLRRQLLSTGDSPLIERNTWKDFYWGCCRNRGGNRLGRLLEGVRQFYFTVEDCKRPGDVCTDVELQPQDGLTEPAVSSAVYNQPESLSE
jgi:ribA/ribD-fused uncharacterized protein